MSEKERIDVETLTDNPDETQDTQTDQTEVKIEGPETPEQTILRLENEKNEFQDKWMRALAELDNVRKRTAKDQQQAIRLVSDNLLLDFLEVIDNFDRALHSFDENTNLENFQKGIDLIYQQLLAVLDRRGVKEIESVGKPFDPDWHEAMLQVESEQPPDTVVDVIQKGYKIHDRVLRHARVTVSKS